MNTLFISNVKLFILIEELCFCFLHSVALVYKMNLKSQELGT